MAAGDRSETGRTRGIDDGQRRLIERMRNDGLRQADASRATGLSKRTITKYWYEDENRGKVRE